jgi:hypothetical protein
VTHKPPSIADENASIMAQVLGRIAQPGNLIDFAERRAALMKAAAGDDIEAIPDDLTVEYDAAEAERFRLECERDLRGEDE